MREGPGDTTAETAPTRKKSIAWLVPATLGAGAQALSMVIGSIGAYTASTTNSAGAGLRLPI